MNPSPSDIPEPIRHWLSTDHRKCRRQKQLADILDVIDTFVPMSIDRGERITALERRIGRLEDCQQAASWHGHLRVDLDDAVSEAKRSVDQLRELLLLRGPLEVEPADQCAYLVGQRPEVVNSSDDHYR